MKGLPGMEIEVNLDMMLLKRKMTLVKLSQLVGVSVTNLSLLKNGRVRGLRFVTLAAICRELKCQPGDLLTYKSDDYEETRTHERGVGDE